jgi:hypothetical protein
MSRSADGWVFGENGSGWSAFIAYGMGTGRFGCRKCLKKDTNSFMVNLMAGHRLLWRWKQPILPGGERRDNNQNGAWDNCDGVDPNRNFDVRGGRSTSTLQHRIHQSTSLKLKSKPSTVNNRTSKSMQLPPMVKIPVGYRSDQQRMMLVSVQWPMNSGVPRTTQPSSGYLWVGGGSGAGYPAGAAFD